MNIDEHVAMVEQAGVRLAAAAERAGLDAAVPTCPGWRIRDLIAHTGGVHRWAAWHVATASPVPADAERRAALFAAPEDDGVLEWFRTGHAELVRTLRTADPAVNCWTFLRGAPSPLAFWARRQAHETAMHQVDAELATGAATPFTPAFAADGIDELLTGFLTRPRGRLTSDPPVSLAVAATDAAASWTIRIEPDRRVTVAGVREDADCVLSGPAHDLYLLLWNRGGADGLTVRGDRGVLELWREKAGIV